MTDDTISQAIAWSKFESIWLQRKIPVVYRSGIPGEKLEVRMPERKVPVRCRSVIAGEWLTAHTPEPPRQLVFDWLCMDRSRHMLSYDAQREVWSMPVAWFRGRPGANLVDRLLYEFDAVYVIQPFRVMEICAPACRRARGHECRCQCMGAYHALGDGHGWFDVHDAFSFRWAEREVACRLITVKTDRHRPRQT